MIVVGLTGGIASGKTTIVKFLKKKRFPVHDSDAVVWRIYSKPSAVFIKYLKTIGLKHALKKNKINKVIIREEIYSKFEKGTFFCGEELKPIFENYKNFKYSDRSHRDPEDIIKIINRVDNINCFISTS